MDGRGIGFACSKSILPSSCGDSPGADVMSGLVPLSRPPDCAAGALSKREQPTKAAIAPSQQLFAVASLLLLTSSLIIGALWLGTGMRLAHRCTGRITTV